MPNQAIAGQGTVRTLEGTCPGNLSAMVAIPASATA